jgi:class 3 adenylate cyclase/tetratricopeptide (TPR) repeat protein
VLDALVTAAQAACRRHGVALLAVDVDRDGGKFLMSAGGVHATTDDETVIALAAREVVATPTPLRLKAGLNRGVVFAGPVGSAARQTFTTIGDTTNTAARVMAAAPPGSVLATEDFLARSRTVFATTPVAPFAAKGKSEPIRAAIIGEPIGQRQVTTAEVFGRDDELAAIRTALAAPRAVAVVSGDAGIGKSSVIAAVAGAWTAGPVTTIEGGRYLALTPYGSLRRPLAALLGVRSPEDLADLVARRAPAYAELAPLLGPLVGLELDATAASSTVAPAFRRQRTLDALIAVVATEPPGRLVVVEDAHWLDEATTAALEALARRGPSWAYLIGTRQPGEHLPGDPAATTTIALDLIKPAAARQLVRSLTADHPLAPATVDAIVTKADGQPLFLVQVTEAVRRGADLDELAEGLEPVLAAILDQVDRAGRDLAASGSVIGQRIDLELHAAVADLARSELERRLAVLDVLLRLTPNEARFVHALLRDAAYNSLPYRRRVELHTRVADLLAARHDEPVELRAIHEQRAHRWELAFPLCVEAARRSQAAAAPVEAIRFYADALDARRHLGLHTREVGAEIAEEQAELLRMVGRPDEALRVIAQGLRLTAQPQRRVRLRLLRNRAKIDQGEIRTAVASLTRLADDGSLVPEDRCRAVADLAAALRQLGRARAAVERLQRHDDLAQGDDENAAAVIVQMAMALGEIGDPRALEVSRQALALTQDRRRQATMHNNIGIELYYLSQWDEAVVSFQAALVDFTAVGDSTEAARVINNLAEIALDQGRYDSAAEELRLAHDTFAAGHHAYGMILVLTNQARLATATGEINSARVAVDATRRWQADAGTTFNAGEIDAAECELLLAAGDLAAASSLASAALAAAEERDTAVSVRARLLRLRGTATADPADLRAAAAAARAGGSPYEEALALLALDPNDDDAKATLAGLGVALLA